MARDKGLLSDLQIRHWIKAGTPLAKADGNGLTFTLSAAGVAGWILRYRHGGRRRELTIGRYPDIGLALPVQIIQRARRRHQGYTFLRASDARLGAMRNATDGRFPDSQRTL